MQHPNAFDGEHLQSRSASWPCKPFVDQQYDFCQKDSPNLFSKDCCSQPGSSVSAYSNDMSSSTEGNVQLEESALQCEEHPFLSSPQDSDTSAFSHQDPSRYYSPMLPLARHAPSPPTQRVPIFEVSGQPSFSEVPTDCIWATMSVAGSARHGYTDPGPSSAIYQIATTYGFTPMMVNVGTSYFRRLAASNYAMMQVGLASPQFCTFMLPMEVLPLPSGPKPLVGAIHAKYLPTNEAWLTLIHLTCIYLAAKALEYVPCKNMLQTMMGHIYGAEPCQVSKDLVGRLEMECFEALDYRLGPVYRTESTEERE